MYSHWSILLGGNLCEIYRRWRSAGMLLHISRRSEHRTSWNNTSQQDLQTQINYWSELQSSLLATAKSPLEESTSPRRQHINAEDPEISELHDYDTESEELHSSSTSSAIIDLDSCKTSTFDFQFSRPDNSPFAKLKKIFEGYCSQSKYPSIVLSPQLHSVLDCPKTNGNHCSGLECLSLDDYHNDTLYDPEESEDQQHYSFQTPYEDLHCIDKFFLYMYRAWRAKSFDEHFRPDTRQMKDIFPAGSMSTEETILWYEVSYYFSSVLQVHHWALTLNPGIWQQSLRF